MILKNSLSFRIITRVLLITITLFVIILSGYYYYTRNLIRESTQRYCIEKADNLAGKIEQILQPMEKVAQMLALSLEIGLIESDSMMAVLETILSRNEGVYGTSIAFEPDYFPDKGKYYMLYAYRDRDTIQSILLGNEKYDYFYKDWYQIPATMKTSYWSEPYYDEGGGNVLMATFSVPFYVNKQGERQLAGISTVDIELGWLTDIVSEVRIFETGYAFMISRKGVAITHPDRNQIMNSSIFSIAEDWKTPILREIGRELMQGKSNFREYIIPGRKKQWIYYRNLNSNLWSIGVVYPDNEMFAPLKQMTTMVILLIVAGLLLLTLVTAGIVNRLASPLTYFANSARSIAQGNFNVKLPPVKTRDEMFELHNAFTHMQLQLAKYIDNLKETTAAKEKIESELRIAREIQMSMIPHTFPPFPDLPQISLYAMLKSAKEVGGDLYDFFVKDKNKFCFAIGDVSGKGVPASLFMAVTRTLLRSISDKEESPARIMECLNKSLAYNNESNMFVTFFLGILELDTGLLRYANAGHNPPVLISQNGETRMFETAKAIPLGLFEEFQYPESKLQLNNGDIIFAYTDGVNEAENEKAILFGDVQMLNQIAKCQNPNPETLIHCIETAIEAHVKDFPQSDDITMMTIMYNEQAAKI
jgi:phosphoserine phosphatase RsbU/P